MVAAKTKSRIGIVTGDPKLLIRSEIQSHDFPQIENRKIGKAYLKCVEARKVTAKSPTKMETLIGLHALPPRTYSRARIITMLGDIPHSRIGLHIRRFC